MISNTPGQLAMAGSKPASELAFLHIGKNAGTQIMFLAQQLKPHGVTVHQLPHDAKLCRLPEKLPYFFSIRNQSSIADAAIVVADNPCCLCCRP